MLARARWARPQAQDEAGEGRRAGCRCPGQVSQRGSPTQLSSRRGHAPLQPRLLLGTQRPPCPGGAPSLEHRSTWAGRRPLCTQEATSGWPEPRPWGLHRARVNGSRVRSQHKPGPLIATITWVVNREPFLRSIKSFFSALSPASVSPDTDQAGSLCRYDVVDPTIPQQTKFSGALSRVSSLDSPLLPRDSPPGAKRREDG